MSFEALQRGIAAVQAGNMQEGEQFLREALENPALQGNIRAVAYMWFAEISPDTGFKIQCYNAALSADPGNSDVQNRLAALMAQQLPPSQQQQPKPPSSPPTTMPPSQKPTQSPPATLPGTGPLSRPKVAASQAVSVLNGPNGRGTAFFVLPDGLLATTRFVVGEMPSVRLQSGGKEVTGRVMRSYPMYDLALIRTELSVEQVRAVTPYPDVPEETPLTAACNHADSVLAKRRTTDRKITPGWFPTTFSAAPDAGGNPLFDDRKYLVGMLTRNAGRSSGYLYGLHISVIRQQVNAFLSEDLQDTVYCGTCGNRSRAGKAHLYFCEHCGGVFPDAPPARKPHPQAEFYYDKSQIACIQCESRTGFDRDQLCLRCGADQQPAPKTQRKRKA